MAALQAAYNFPLPGADATHSPLTRLKVFALGYILNEPNARFWRFWMNYTVYGSRNEELRRHQNHWFKKQNAFWGKLVGEAISCGELPSETDSAATAEDLLVFAHGLMVRQILQPDRPSQSRCRKLLEQYFERLQSAPIPQRKAVVEKKGPAAALRRGRAAA